MTRLDLTSTASPMPMMQAAHRPPRYPSAVEAFDADGNPDWVRKHLGRCLFGFHPMTEDQLAKKLVLIDEVFS